MTVLLDVAAHATTFINKRPIPPAEKNVDSPIFVVKAVMITNNSAKPQ